MKCGRYIDVKRPVEGVPVPEVFRPYFCPSCLKKTGHDPFEPPFCSICGMKFYGDHLKNHRCGRCLGSPPDAGRVRAAGMYDGVMKEAVHLLKYSGRIGLALPLGALMLDAYRRYLSDLPLPLLVPVPLHPSKLGYRGFNQSFLLARNLCRRAVSDEGGGSKLSIDCHSLVRSRKTPSQTDFTVEQRKRNVKDAFDVTRTDHIRGRRVVLVDDVYTTGATCSEAAGRLLKAGAESVDTLVAARAF
ncbi:MAG: ComF family protein [Desulfarculaceae bacterium]|nr:ComF family protein [Desulfarculaceae bacterium]